MDVIILPSFKFFTIMGLDLGWLINNPNNWWDSFRVAKDFVTNNVAERLVTMRYDYATILSKDYGIGAGIYSQTS